MVIQSSQNINQENHLKNKINFYRFDNILVYIIIIIDKIITFIKIGFLRRKEKRKNEEKVNYYFIWRTARDTFPSFQNKYFQIKNESIISLLLKKHKKNNSNNVIIKENQKERQI